LSNYRIKGDEVMSRKYNAKHEYIKTLMATVGAARREDGKGSSKVTFITPFGIVTGEEAKMMEFDISSKEAHLEDLERASEEGEVPLYQLADSFYLMHKKENFEDGSTYENEDSILRLHDVTIFSGEGHRDRIKTPYFTLFLDQVIGTIFGEFKLPTENA
jgi:hypothetical protein